MREPGISRMLKKLSCHADPAEREKHFCILLKINPEILHDAQTDNPPQDSFSNPLELTPVSSLRYG